MQKEYEVRDVLEIDPIEIKSLKNLKNWDKSISTSVSNLTINLEESCNKSNLITKCIYLAWQKLSRKDKIILEKNIGKENIVYISDKILRAMASLALYRGGGNK